MPRTAAKRPAARPRKAITAKELAEELEPGLNALFGTKHKNYEDDQPVDEMLDKRHKTYGYFFGVAEISQGFKKQLFYYLTARNKDLAPDQTEALEMILHKIARIVNGDENHIDSWHDISGYATLVASRLKGTYR